MANRTARILLHSLGAAVMIYGYKGLWRLGDFDAWMRALYGGRAQFLTINGLFAAILVMLSGLMVDLLSIGGALGIASWVQSFKRLLLLISTPVAIVIASVYWPLILFLPHLMDMRAPSGEPTSSTESPAPFRIPLDIDLSLHGFPGPFLLLDFFLFEAKFSKRVMTRDGPLLAILTCLAYSVWVEHCASKNGFFPYPFLTLSPFPIRVLIYITCTVVSFLMFRAANGLHR